MTKSSVEFVVASADEFNSEEVWSRHLADFDLAQWTIVEHREVDAADTIFWDRPEDVGLIKFPLQVTLTLQNGNHDQEDELDPNELAARKASSRLTDKDWEVRYHACQELQGLGHFAKPYVEALECLLGVEKDSEVKRAAKKAIKDIKANKEVAKKTVVKPSRERTPPPAPKPKPPPPARYSWEEREAPRPGGEALTMLVRVPEGAHPGEKLQVTGPTGEQFVATVPEGFEPGMEFVLDMNVSREGEKSKPAPTEYADQPGPISGSTGEGNAGELPSSGASGSTGQRIPRWASRMAQAQQDQFSGVRHEKGHVVTEATGDTDNELNEESEIDEDQWPRWKGGEKKKKKEPLKKPVAPDTVRFSGPRANFRFFEGSSREAVLPMMLEREGMTPSEITDFWEQHYGVQYASRIKFFVAKEDEEGERFLRKEPVPLHPAVVRLEEGVGSVLYALATALEQFGHLTAEQADDERTKRTAKQKMELRRKRNAEAGRPSRTLPQQRGPGRGGGLGGEPSESQRILQSLQARGALVPHLAPRKQKPVETELAPDDE